jgi:exodeoxyribonuclease VII large subunit
VIQDFLNIAGRRDSHLNILICPVSVQGDSAPEEIETALADLNSFGLVDVIVLARGGGSLEDLAAFNSERVARAIASSRLSVVSAVGHETDFTIADFVADLRVPTPSAAAELITEAQHRIAEHLATLEHRLERAAHFQLLQARQRLTRLPINRGETRIHALLHQMEQRLDDLSFRQEAALSSQLRGYQRNVADLAAAILRHDPRQRLALSRARLLSCRTRLDRSLERQLHASAATVNALDARLHSLSPLAVLDRGYALVVDAAGGVVRSTAQVAPGDQVTTRLCDGAFTSRVEAARSTGNPSRRNLPRRKQGK